MITLGLASRETVFVPLFFFLLFLIFPRAINEAAQRSNSAQRSRMCDADETSYRKCRPPLRARSTLVSKDLVGGLWWSETGLVDGIMDGVGPGGIAHTRYSESKRVLLWCVVPEVPVLEHSRRRCRSCSGR